MRKVPDSETKEGNDIGEIDCNMYSIFDTINATPAIDLSFGATK